MMSVRLVKLGLGAVSLGCNPGVADRRDWTVSFADERLKFRAQGIVILQFLFVTPCFEKNCFCAGSVNLFFEKSEINCGLLRIPPGAAALFLQNDVIPRSLLTNDAGGSAVLPVF